MRAKIKPLVEELNILERQKKEEENSKLVGKYFKYRNSYSCPESDKDRWWIYRHVISMNDNELSGVTFGTDMYGKVEIERGAIPSYLTGWTEIEEAEYLEAWEGLISDIGTLDV